MRPWSKWRSSAPSPWGRRTVCPQINQGVGLMEKNGSPMLEGGRGSKLVYLLLASGEVSVSAPKWCVQDVRAFSSKPQAVAAC